MDKNFNKFIKVLLCSLIVSVNLLTLVGCNLFHNKVYTFGDLEYKMYGENDNKRIELWGFSKEGKDKPVIVIPKEIDGVKIKSIECGNPFFTNSDSGKMFASDRLSKLYFEYATISHIQDDTFRECSNLRQVFVINFREENTDWVSCVQNTIENEGYPKRTVYVFKGAYDLLPSYVHKNYVNENDRFFKPANVTYYYNYFGSENGGCYWIDNVEVGERIDYIPKDPVRIVDGKINKMFGGWYKEPECINKWDFETDVMPNYDSKEFYELKLYAKWI